MSSRINAPRWRGSVESLERRDLLAILLTPKIFTVNSEPFQGVVANIVDTHLATSPSDITSVNLDWGDGSPPDTGSGQVVPVIPGLLEVNGTHTFTQNGTFTVRVTARETNGQTASTASTAVVPAPPVTVNPNAVSGLVGQPLSKSNGTMAVTLATFIDPKASDPASAFNALIAWGDGETSTGKVMGGNGLFTVTGDHTYSAPGSFKFQVTVVGLGNGVNVSTTGTANIVAPSVLKTTGRQIVEPAGQPLSNVTVATFKDTNTNDNAMTLTALINWGDGGTGVGTVAGSDGSFTVSGTYSYAAPGNYPITVTIQNQSGQTATAKSTAAIVNTASASGNFSFSIGLAPIPDNGPNASSGLSNTNRPTFSGNAPAFAVVQLTARRIDVDAPLPLGQAVANGSGQWSLPVGPLSDGVYDVTATVTPPGGSPALMTNPPPNNLDQFIIDTAPPRVVAVSLIGTSGRVLVSLRSGISGLNLASLLDAGNYTFTGPLGFQFHPASIRPIFRGKLPTDPQSVVLMIGNKPKLHGWAHALSINGARITDRAGNPLQGGTNVVYPLTSAHTPAFLAGPRSPRGGRL